MSEKPEPNKKSKQPTYPGMESACLVCHGHGHEILEDLTYCQCRRCKGSGVDPKVKVEGVPESAFITLAERGERVAKLAELRSAERRKEKKKKNGLSRGTNGMSDLDV